MLVDVHVHLNNYTKRPLESEVSLRRLLTRMKRHNVDHAVVLSSYKVNEERPAAESVVDLCRDYPQLSVVEGITWQDGKPHDLEGIGRRLEAGDTVGLKMYPGYVPFYPHDAACEPVYELALEHDVPVMFHTGDTYAKGAKVKYSHPLHIDDVAVDHPDLKIIICHLGNPWFRDTAEVLYKNDNCFADISGLVLEGFEANLERWVAEQVRDIVEYAGDPEYLLYGTDWPLVRMGPYVRFLETLELSTKARERITWRNADDLFRLGLAKRKPKPAVKEPAPAPKRAAKKARKTAKKAPRGKSR